MREGEEEEVALLDFLQADEAHARPSPEVRMDEVSILAGVSLGGDLLHFDLGMAEEEPEKLAPHIS
jgi:hypothetical protein